MNDLQIARSIKPEAITSIAKKCGIDHDALIPYGFDKAKLNSNYCAKIQAENKPGKLILVTAINPTKAGEGKSTVTIGLLDGLTKIKKKAMGALREPSMGPVFGLKGGATGGGYSQVIPMEDINLHFTGDFHALTAATNLVAAVLDNSIYQGNPLDIDINRIVWTRCVDMNDRTLRTTTIGQGARINGVQREDHTVITVATELMAILCLSTDLKDLQDRVARCIVAYDTHNNPVTVKDLNVDGAVAVVLKDAIQPNLVQTLEHNPVLIHGGPFANIAHGCNSLIATKTALALSDYVVTEAGFGSDLGAEKFLDIKCRKGHLAPDCIVCVATIRALKLHGGMDADGLTTENVDALKKGYCNLKHHVLALKQYGVPVVVAINHFSADTQFEIDTLTRLLDEDGFDHAFSDGWAKGGDGCMELAETVVNACDKPKSFHLLYPDEMSLEEKCRTIAQKIYGAKDIELSDIAKDQLQSMQPLYGTYPICMAKTQNSLTDDPKRYGVPDDFVIHIREFKVNTGAQFVVAYAGNILTMPGLPKDPAACHIGFDDEGNIVGLF